jgi:hypothetical protein
MNMAFWKLLLLVVLFAACGCAPDAEPLGEAAPLVTNVPDLIHGTWHFQDVASPFPAGTPVPPPFQEAVQRLRTRLAGTELAFANGIVKLHQPGHAPVVGPVACRVDGPAGGVLILPPAIEAVLASGREQRFEQVEDRLHLPRPEGILVFAR